MARLLVNLTHRYPGEIGVRPVAVNGDAGVVISIAGAVDLVAAFELRDAQVAAIRMARIRSSSRTWSIRSCCDSGTKTPFGTGGGLTSVSGDDASGDDSEFRGPASPVPEGPQG